MRNPAALTSSILVLAGCRPLTQPAPNSTGARPPNAGGDVERERTAPDGADAGAKPFTATNTAPPPFVADFIRRHGLCTPRTPVPVVEPAAAQPSPRDGGAISVRSGEMREYGRLPPEVIQYIVRRSYATFRLCYEQGLRKDPTLEGKVVTRFTIERDGTVTHVEDAGSQMTNDVIACTNQEFARLCFPPVEGGVVKVRYPIMFSPGD